MEDKLIWVWIVAGLVPYKVTLNWLDRRCWRLEIKALFWAFKIQRRRNGRKDWALRLPLIERLRDAIWSAVMRLRGSLGENEEPPAAS